MPRYDFAFDKDKLPEPGKYFCTKPGCNKSQLISFKGQTLIPCPKCGGIDFKTV